MVVKSYDKYIIMIMILLMMSIRGREPLQIRNKGLFAEKDYYHNIHKKAQTHKEKT